jgi:hypothetical protein
MTGIKEQLHLYAGNKYQEFTSPGIKENGDGRSNTGVCHRGAGQKE